MPQIHASRENCAFFPCLHRPHLSKSKVGRIREFENSRQFIRLGFAYFRKFYQSPSLRSRSVKMRLWKTEKVFYSFYKYFSKIRANVKCHIRVYILSSTSAHTSSVIIWVSAKERLYHQPTNGLFNTLTERTLNLTYKLKSQFLIIY